MPTLETASLDALFCLFKGEWGTRKSTQALSFPRPQYWFSFDAINAQTLQLKSGTTKQDGVEAGKRIAGIPVNTMEDFNAETSALQTFVRLSKDIHKYHKVNVILIAHVIRTDEKLAGGKTHVSRTIVTGAKKIAAKIPGNCHEVYHFNMKGDFQDSKYSLLTTHSQEDFARTALPLAKEIVFEDDPIYDKFIIPAITKLKSLESKQPVKF